MHADKGVKLQIHILSVVGGQARTDTGVELVDGVFAEEIRITEHMFSDHSPVAYLRAMTAVGLDTDISQ